MLIKRFFINIGRGQQWIRHLTQYKGYNIRRCILTAMIILSNKAKLAGRKIRAKTLTGSTRIERGGGGILLY